jgi:hypothetical protein
MFATGARAMVATPPVRRESTSPASASTLSPLSAGTDRLTVAPRPGSASATNGRGSGIRTPSVAPATTAAMTSAAAQQPHCHHATPQKRRRSFSFSVSFSAAAGAVPFAASGAADDSFVPGVTSAAEVAAGAAGPRIIGFEVTKTGAAVSAAAASPGRRACAVGTGPKCVGGAFGAIVLLLANAWRTPGGKSKRYRSVEKQYCKLCL